MNPDKLSTWLNEMSEGNHPEVIRFIKELQIQIEFGAFDGSEEDEDPYA